VAAFETHASRTLVDAAMMLGRETRGHVLRPPDGANEGRPLAHLRVGPRQRLPTFHACRVARRRRVPPCPVEKRHRAPVTASAPGHIALLNLRGGDHVGIAELDTDPKRLPEVSRCIGELKSVERRVPSRLVAVTEEQ
jgi:hypothetical protein